MKKLGKQKIETEAGHLYHSSSVLMSQIVGESDNYKIIRGYDGITLGVESKKTGQTFVLPLDKLIDLAVTNGVDMGDLDWKDYPDEPDEKSS